MLVGCGLFVVVVRLMTFGHHAVDIATSAALYLLLLENCDFRENLEFVSFTHRQENWVDIVVQAPMWQGFEGLGTLKHNGDSFVVDRSLFCASCARWLITSAEAWI